MIILVTGGCGSVGQSTVKSLLARGHRVRVFDRDTVKNRKVIRAFGRNVEPLYGNILHVEDVKRAVKDVDAVIHLAALIPPGADRKPELAELINVDGTHTLVYAMERLSPAPTLIFTSSVAVYGDRIRNPYIGSDDYPNPNARDVYARQKLRCEEIIKSSSLKWAIFRLSYIVDPERLKLDPIMFDMPLNTSLEICDYRDVGTAIASSVTAEGITGKTLHIAGGTRCRTTYRDYLESMLDIFGFGNKKLPETAFSTTGYHCGFMTTAESEEKLKYQHHSLSDFYEEVRKRFAVKSFFLRLFRRLGWKILLLKSPYFLQSLSRKVGAGISRGNVVLRFIFGPEGKRV